MFELKGIDIPTFSDLCYEQMMEQKAVVRTPGGRVGDDRRLGSRTNGENWVERSKPGGTGDLPEYIRIVRNGLMKHGHTEGEATALAVAAIKRWATGRDHVSPKVRKAAVAALAEWEKMRATAHKPHKSDHSAHDGSIMPRDTSGTEEKADSMEIEHKTVGVNGLKVDSPDEGIITAFVSVTGIVDNVKDIIEPGAYAKTLSARTPKGVWSHEWSSPVAKTLDIKELLPGDPGLPKTLPNGDPWPDNAGALLVKMQFNLNTERGRTAYEDVRFFGEEQEWSIGYNVPIGGATKDMKQGVRRIQTLDLYEFSPVLFGAMPSARTAMGVKAAQMANAQYKSLFGDDYYMKMDVESLDEFMAEAKSLIGAEFETKSIMATEKDPEDYADEDEPLPVFAEKGLLSADNIDLLEKAASVITELLEAVQGGTEAKAQRFDDVTLDSVVDDLYETELDEKTVEEIVEAVDSLNVALESKDFDTAEQFGHAILDVVDDYIDDVDEKTTEALSSLAKALHDTLIDAEEKAARGKRRKKPVDPDGDGDDDSNDPNDELDSGEVDDPEDMLDGGADEAEEDGNGRVRKPSRRKKKDSGTKVVFDTTEVKSLQGFLDSLG